jgi:CHAD domain-containing protein
LKNTYKQGRKALKKVKTSPDAEHFHEWRKKVKYLWYQIRLLWNAWPEVLSGYEKSLYKLSYYLGLEHDLAELERLNSDSVIFKQIPDAEKKVLSKKIEHRRQKIQSKTWPQGERLYIEKPKEFTDRIAQYWEVATAHG